MNASLSTYTGSAVQTAFPLFSSFALRIESSSIQNEGTEARRSHSLTIWLLTNASAIACIKNRNSTGAMSSPCFSNP